MPQPSQSSSGTKEAIDDLVEQAGTLLAQATELAAASDNPFEEAYLISRMARWDMIPLSTARDLISRALNVR